MKQKEERAMLIATFELYDWLPMSVIYRGRHSKETLLCRQTDGGILRHKRGDTGAVCNTKRAAFNQPRMEKREKREWSSISLPSLRLMHARLLRKIAQECSDARKDEAS